MHSGGVERKKNQTIRGLLTSPFDINTIIILVAEPDIYTLRMVRISDDLFPKQPKEASMNNICVITEGPPHILGTSMSLS